MTLCDSESVCNLNWSPRTKTHLYRNFAHLLDLFSVSKTTRELLLKWSNEPVRLSSEVSPQKLKLILNYNSLYLFVCVCMSFQKLNTTHKTNTINRQLMMICVWFQFQVKMPQFLVEDVIAETCDETAIMGERNFWKHFEPKWSESSKWSRWQIASSWIIRLKCQQDVNISNSKLPFIVEIVFSHSSKHGHFMGGFTYLNCCNNCSSIAIQSPLGTNCHLTSCQINVKKLRKLFFNNTFNSRQKQTTEKCSN